MSVPRRVVLDRPVLLTARSAHPGPANPFARENYQVPFMLVLHSRSLAASHGRDAEVAELLVTLGHSPFADVWFTSGEHPYGDDWPQAEPGAGLAEPGLAGLPVEVDYDAGCSRLAALGGR